MRRHLQKQDRYMQRIQASACYNRHACANRTYQFSFNPSCRQFSWSVLRHETVDAICVTSFPSVVKFFELCDPSCWLVSISPSKYIILRPRGLGLKIDRGSKASIKCFLQFSLSFIQSLHIRIVPCRDFLNFLLLGLNILLCCCFADFDK